MEVEGMQSGQLSKLYSPKKCIEHDGEETKIVRNNKRHKIQRFVKLLAVRAKKTKIGQPYKNERPNISFNLKRFLSVNTSNILNMENSKESNARCPPSLNGILVEERVILQI